MVDEQSNSGNLPIKEIFEGMEKLSQRPYEYYASGLGFILVFFGVFGQPLKSLSQEELWGIAIFGCIALISGLIVAVKKMDYTMRTNLEKLEYKKFIAEQKTRRLEKTNQNGPDMDMTDLDPL